jgi:hypothetical protein
LAGAPATAILNLSLSPLFVLALLRRLLLLPLLSPLLAALLLASFNPRPNLSMRLLIWRSPALPIGLWIGAAAGGGALLSATATALALRQAGSAQRRSGWRRQASIADNPEPWAESRSETWRQSAEAEQPRNSVANWFRRPQEESTASRGDGDASTSRQRSAAGAGPERAPGEPAPTVAVPFRVLHRPKASAAGVQARTPCAEPAAAKSVSTVQHEAQAEPVAAGDDWGQSEGDEW